MIARWSLVFSILFLAGVYFWPQRDAELTENFDSIFVDHNISMLHIVGEHLNLKIEKKQNLWWVIEPEIYLADQDFVENNLQHMFGNKPLQSFILEEDYYELKPGRALIDITYLDTRRQRLIVGTTDSTGQFVYVLDSDINRVFVVHNVWAQFLYYTASEYFHKSLPIIGQEVLDIELFEQSKSLFKISSKNKSSAEIFWNNKKQIIEKKTLAPFFHLLAQSPLKPMDWKAEAPPSYSYELLVNTEKGNIRFFWLKNSGPIYIPEFKVFAKPESLSIDLLQETLKKVLNHGKK